MTGHILGWQSRRLRAERLQRTLRWSPRWLACQGSVACTIVTIWPREFLIRASFNRVDEMLREKCVRWLAASVLALPQWFFPSPIKLSPVESRTWHSYISPVSPPDGIVARDRADKSAHAVAIAPYRKMVVDPLRVTFSSRRKRSDMH